MSSFDKSYPNRKDHIEPYHGSKANSHSCRNHGSCSRCEGNRTFDLIKKAAISKDEIKQLDTLEVEE